VITQSLLVVVASPVGAASARLIDQYRKIPYLNAPLTQTLTLESFQIARL
jgi:hypothetical protein